MTLNDSQLGNNYKSCIPATSVATTFFVDACDLQANSVDAQLSIHNAVFYMLKKKGFVSHNRAAILSGVSLE